MTSFLILKFAIDCKPKNVNCFIYITKIAPVIANKMGRVTKKEELKQAADLLAIKLRRLDSRTAKRFFEQIKLEEQI